MIGCFYARGHWVALHLRHDPASDDTILAARLGECPGDPNGRDVTLARSSTACAALDLGLARLADGWRHAADEPPAPEPSARAALARPTALDAGAASDPGGRPGKREQARAAVAYATSADGRGFLFIGNPASR
jgi:hypothetical protein